MPERFRKILSQVEQIPLLFVAADDYHGTKSEIKDFVNQQKVR
jgi:hypothetical protein